MKLIDVSTAKYPDIFAMVDDQDYEWLSQWNWHAVKDRNAFYAVRNEGIRPNRTVVKMHRVIVSTSAASVDHADGNGLNNQRANLRPCSNSENMRNRAKRPDNKSGYIGVCLKKGRWVAEIKVDGRSRFLGRFENPVEAARIRDAAAIRFHGEFARLNFK